MPLSWHLCRGTRRIEGNSQREKGGGLVYGRTKTNGNAAACLTCGTSGGEFN